MKKVIIILFSISFLLFGGYSILSNTDKDIIKFDGRIYSNITDAHWFEEEEKNRYQKGERLGEIKRTSNSSLLIWNFSATKLPEGTTIYKTDETEVGTPLLILAEGDNGEISFYRWLPEE
ncbi:hypothetical protein V1502_10400 [Bacillus sp. SCS-153A]|uniref:hypothetical protein n=1 Tax=Rossellomorea sedimentorum TaxID=3115294 RepID=UPI003905BE54